MLDAEYLIMDLMFVTAFVAPKFLPFYVVLACFAVGFLVYLFSRKTDKGLSLKIHLRDLACVVIASYVGQLLFKLNSVVVVL
jgi:hypothetical protein